MSGAYSMNPGAIRGLSKEGRAWFRATLRNVRESNARIAKASRVLTLAELNSLIAERYARLAQWANGGRKAAGKAPEGPRVVYGRVRYRQGVPVRVGLMRDAVMRRALRGADVLTVRRAA